MLKINGQNYEVLKEQEGTISGNKHLYVKKPNGKALYFVVNYGKQNYSMPQSLTGMGIFTKHLV